MSNQSYDHLKFNTIAQHGGQSIDTHSKARAVPIYQTTSYGFENIDHAASLFQMQEEGYIFTRVTPIQQIVF